MPYIRARQKGGNARILMEAQSQEEFAEHLVALPKHACDIQEWEGGRCDLVGLGVKRVLISISTSDGHTIHLPIRPEPKRNQILGWMGRAGASFGRGVEEDLKK